jgi:hypothetical protein
MQGRAGGQARSPGVAGIPVNLWMNKNNVQRHSRSDGHHENETTKAHGNA